MYRKYISPVAIAATLSFILMVTVYFGERYSNLETVKNGAILSFVAQNGGKPEPVPVKVIEEIPVKSLDYIEIINSCGPYFDGTCVNLRSGAGESFRSLASLRNGVVLRVSDKIESEGKMWYKVIFDEYVRYPNRLTGPLYVSADYARAFSVPEELIVSTTTKHIIIDRSEQNLYAYDDDVLFMKIKISAGLVDTPTPRGNFKIMSKTPSRYMQGPLPGISDQVYDLPGVPFTMYFTAQGGAIHGAYWHDNFGKVWSHGCVNLSLEDAEKLYSWTPLGAKVLVRD